MLKAVYGGGSTVPITQRALRKAKTSPCKELLLGEAHRQNRKQSSLNISNKKKDLLGKTLSRSFLRTILYSKNSKSRHRYCTQVEHICRLQTYL